MKYYIGVCVLHCGHAVVTKPYAELEECIGKLKDYIASHKKDVASTTYMVREGENLTLPDVFGHPKSRDLIQDRRFMQSI